MKSFLDDLEEIGKRRAELFPKVGLQPAEPFVQPVGQPAPATPVWIDKSMDGHEDFGSFKLPSTAEVMRLLARPRFLDSYKRPERPRLRGCLENCPEGGLCARFCRDGSMSCGQR